MNNLGVQQLAHSLWLPSSVYTSLEWRQRQSSWECLPLSSEGMEFSSGSDTGKKSFWRFLQSWVNATPAEHASHPLGHWCCNKFHGKSSHCINQKCYSTFSTAAITTRLFSYNHAWTLRHATKKFSCPLEMRSNWLPVYFRILFEDLA